MKSFVGGLGSRTSGPPLKASSDTAELKWQTASILKGTSSLLSASGGSSKDERMMPTGSVC